MSKKRIYDQKHLTTSQRIHIEKGLNDGLSFAAIARKLEKHPSTITKEVKKYRTFQNMQLIKVILCAVPDLRNAPCVFFVTNLIV